MNKIKTVIIFFAMVADTHFDVTDVELKKEALVEVWYKEIKNKYLQKQKKWI